MQKAGAYFTYGGFPQTEAFAYFCGNLLHSVIWNVGLIIPSVFKKLLELLKTADNVLIVSNMKAILLISTRIIYSESAFAELVLLRLPKPLDGSPHDFKFKLAYIVRGKCV